MSVSVQIDISEIEKLLTAENEKKAKIAVANQMIIDMDKFVPMRHGTLRASGHVQSSGDIGVVYTTVYARAHFYGTNGIVRFRKYTTSGTGKRWDEKAQSRYSEQWAEVAKKGLGL